MNSFSKDDHPTLRRWRFFHWIGVVYLALGISCLVTYDNTLYEIRYLFLFALITGGLFDIVFSSSNRFIYGWGWLLACGIVDIIFAVIILLIPDRYLALCLFYLIGSWIILRSVFNMGFTFDIQRFNMKMWISLIILISASLVCSFIYIISPIFVKDPLKSSIAMTFILYGISRIVMFFGMKKMIDMNEL